MRFQKGIKFLSYVEFWEYLPENERIIVDCLRHIILKTLPKTCQERLAYNVPFYYGKKRICLIWPSFVPRGGIKSGVLLGFAQGNKLADLNGYLTHGTNKRLFYKIYNSENEINERKIKALLRNAMEVDDQFK